MNNGEAISLFHDMQGCRHQALHTNDCRDCERCQFYHTQEQLDEAVDLAISALEKQEADRWIPVTERLPEECEEVNITWINTEPAVYYEDIKNKPFTGTGLYSRGQWYWYSAVCKDYLEERGDSPCDEMDSAIKVTAWKPLPEPYTEEES